MVDVRRADVKQAGAKRVSDEVIAKVQTGSMQMGEADAIALATELYGRGLYGQVVNVCNQIIRHKPTIADAHNILGVSLNALGKPKEGAAAIRRAIKLKPQIASYHTNLGEVLRIAGNLPDSLLALIEAIRLDPGSAQAHNNLGIVRYERKEYGEAIASYARALEINPTFAEAWNNRGNALRRTGDIDEAARAYQQALVYREVYPEAYNNLGTLLAELGKPDQAEHAYRKALQQNPAYVDAHNNLAAHYFAEGRDLDALRELGEALRIATREPKSLVLTARIQMRRANHAPAEQACRIVLDDDPAHVEARVVLGQILYETDRHEEALATLARAVEVDPADAEARNYYGVALKSVGRLDEARDQFLKGLELCDTMYGSYANLGDLVDFAQDRALFDKIEAIMESLVDDPAPARDARDQLIPLHYAYAKALDDIGEHEKALGQYIDGGRLKRATLTYAEAESGAFFEGIKRAFPKELFANRPFVGNPSRSPVFIVGMPRSGSTLVEQIIANHPQVFGGGEVKYLSNALAVLRDRFPFLSQYPEMVSELAAPHYDLLAQRYLADSRSMAGSARLATDKLPTNYFFVGLINLLFPNAKIINTLRNPVDTCLSTFTKLFKDDVPHSYELAELGAYYCHYVDLMAHWRAVLPEGAMITVAYEDVIRDNEAQVRKLLDFLDLPWDEACLAFHKSARPVKTASVAQVRKPLYTTSLERWRKYGAGLDPLVEALRPSAGQIGGLEI